MRAMAPNADLRPFHSSARSASSAATRTVAGAVGQRDRRRPPPRPPRRRRAARRPRRAARRRRRSGSRRGRSPRPPAVISASIISSAAGTMPAAMMPLTVAAASSTDGEVEQHRAHRRRDRREPHRDPRGDAQRALAADERAAQVVARRVGVEAAEHRPPSPSGSTTSTASTCALVTPYGRQCGPPELLATLPPIEHDCWLDGSGAKCSPRWATARDRSRLSTPGSTHATRSSASTSRMRFILVVTITTGLELERHRAAGQPGARAAGHERPAVGGGDPHARLHLGGRQREAHDAGPAFEHRRVAPVEAQLERAGRARGRAPAPRQIGDEGSVGHGASVWRAEACRLRRRVPRSRANGHTRSRRRARVGLLRGSRRGAHVGLRRHVPAQQLGVHLRPRLPGRAHRARAGAGAGLLLLRRPLHRRGGRAPGRGGGRDAHHDAVAVPQAGPASAAWSRSTRRATSSPGWSTARASS